MGSQRVGRDLSDSAHSTYMIHGTLKSREIFTEVLFQKQKSFIACDLHPFQAGHKGIMLSNWSISTRVEIIFHYAGKS